MHEIIKVAAAQLSPIFLSKEKTVEKACTAILDAGKKGARLLVFPEAFIPGYPDWVWLIPNSKKADLDNLYLQLLNNAVSIPDDTTQKLCDTARQAKINVVIGMSEINSERSHASLYNTILTIDDNGDILGKHRKLMATGGERLIWAQGDGSTMSTYETSAGRLGGLICWESYMPLARYAVYEQGAQILALPTWDKSPDWLASLPVFAREGGMFIISSCMVLKMEDLPEEFEFKKLYPKDRQWITKGNSCIVGPNGQILAGPVEAQEEIIYADINLEEILRAKRMFDVAGHYARPDVFDFNVNK